MNAVLPLAAAEPAQREGEGWRLHLIALAAVAALILILFGADAADMVRIWWTTATFNHCLLVLPIIFWLVWQRLPELRRLEPRAWAPGLLLVGAGAVAWLLGEAASVGLVRHAGLVLMLQGAVIACLGKAVARGLLFPLAYALFLIPVGEELVPPLQTVTAKISMALLSLSGTPAHIEGIFISTPGGYFEVAEACSGVQFLIAMIAFGALVGNVCFRTWPRRIAFLAASILVPILANGIRAWATILIADRYGIAFAEGFDHVVYGGVFFAVVMALLLAGAWRFFDRKPGDPWLDPEALADPRPRASRILAITAAALAIAALPVAWSASIAATAEAPPAELTLPDVPGWTRVQPSGRPWHPNYAGADLVRAGRYLNASGQQVDLVLIYFSRQTEGRELVGFGQGPTDAAGKWAWIANGPPPPGGRLDRIASFGTVREVATFYRVGSLTTGSPAAVKFETMKLRLLGGSQAGMAVLVSAAAPAEGVSPRPAIDAFLADLGPIEALANRATGAR